MRGSGALEDAVMLLLKARGITGGVWTAQKGGSPEAFQLGAVNNSVDAAIQNIRSILAKERN